MQARGRVTAAEDAAELEVSVATAAPEARSALRKLTRALPEVFRVGPGYGLPPPAPSTWPAPSPGGAR